MKSMEYAFYLLEKRDRSIGEMEEKLRRREYSDEEISDVMKFLIDKKFLDDKKFAENFVRFKKTIKPVGKYYLLNKLAEKKVPKDIIEQVLSESPDEIAEVGQLADRWLVKNQKISKEKIYEKLSRHLISRGFDWEKIREVLDEKKDVM